MNERTVLSQDEALRLQCVELAIKLTLKDEALFAGGMIEYASRIHNFVTTGNVNKTPIKD
jgi:hypothetical protein